MLNVHIALTDTSHYKWTLWCDHRRYGTGYEQTLEAAKAAAVKEIEDIKTSLPTNPRFQGEIDWTGVK